MAPGEGPLRAYLVRFRLLTAAAVAVSTAAAMIAAWVVGGGAATAFEIVAWGSFAGGHSFATARQAVRLVAAVRRAGGPAVLWRGGAATAAQRNWAMGLALKEAARRGANDLRFVFWSYVPVIAAMAAAAAFVEAREVLRAIGVAAALAACVMLQHRLLVLAARWGWSYVRALNDDVAADGWNCSTLKEKVVHW